jgi:hypothetical protein
MRVISNTAMAALVVAALFLGNCLSCPEALLASQAQQPAHGCCHRGHQPASNTGCQSQALQHFVQPEKGAPPVPAVATLVPMPSDVRLSLPLATDLAGTPEATPPDLVSLHSSFRI